MLSIDLSKQAFKFLKNIPLKQAQQIGRKLQELRYIPFPQDSKLLKGSKDYHRVDSREYRIIYRVENKEIIIIALIGKRNDDDIYKKFDRLQ